MYQIFGFSVGVFYDQPINIIEKISLIKNAGVNAIELSFDSFEEEDFQHLQLEHLLGFDYVSLHLPKHSFDAGNPKTHEIIEKIKHLNSIRKLDLLIVHPDPIKDFIKIIWSAS